MPKLINRHAYILQYLKQFCFCKLHFCASGNKQLSMNAISNHVQNLHKDKRRWFTKDMVIRVQSNDGKPIHQVFFFTSRVYHQIVSIQPYGMIQGNILIIAEIINFLWVRIHLHSILLHKYPGELTRMTNLIKNRYQASRIRMRMRNQNQSPNVAHFSPSILLPPVHRCTWYSRCQISKGSSWCFLTFLTFKAHKRTYLGESKDKS